MITGKSRTNGEEAPRATTVSDSPRGELAMGCEILVADDDDAVRNSLVRLLRCHGYSTLAASTGAGALQLAVRHRPSVILMDAQMPTMSGPEASRCIKAQPALAATQIILLSAAPIPPHEAGHLFVRILQKPCPSAVVIATIETAILHHCFHQISA